MKRNLLIIKSISTALITLLLIATISTSSHALAAYSAGTLVSMTNAERTKNGLGSLNTNGALTSAAQAKANDMLAKNYFAHTSPDGRTPWDFIHDAGYNYTYAGENLAIGYTSASELMNAWMNSASHRENILNGNFRDIGIAVVAGKYDGIDTIVVAQEFGSLSQEAPADEPAQPDQTPQTAGDKAISTPAPAPSASVSVQPVASFEINKEESNFKPKSIYAGEETELSIVISGEINALEVQVGQTKTNMLESGTVSGEGSKKTYLFKQKFDQVGVYDVSVTAQDKNGNSKTLVLGQLAVNQVVIAKNDQNPQNKSLFAGFSDVLKKDWYFIIAGGLILSLLGYMIFRRFKFTKLEKLGMATWDL